MISVSCVCDRENESDWFGMLCSWEKNFVLIWNTTWRFSPLTHCQSCHDQGGVVTMKERERSMWIKKECWWILMMIRFLFVKIFIAYISKCSFNATYAIFLWKTNTCLQFLIHINLSFRRQHPVSYKRNYSSMISGLPQKTVCDTITRMHMLNIQIHPGMAVRIIIIWM